MESAINHYVLLNPPSLFEGTLCVLLFVLVLYGSLRSTKHMVQSQQRAVIVSLHLLSFALILFIIFNPAYRVENYKEDKKNLAIIVDSSWSMNLPGSTDGNSRDRNLKSYLEKNSGFFSQIEKDFYVEYYLFDEELKTASLDSIIQNRPEGSYTKIGKMLEELKDNSNSKELDTAIIISDGSDKEESLDNISELVESVDFPINTIDPVTEENIYDVWVDDIESSEVSFLRYPFTVDVTIKSSIEDGLEIPVSLYEEDKLLAIKEVSLNKDSKEGVVNFEVNPMSLGRKIYTVSIPVLSKELIAENNQKSFFTDVIINKIRVLHVGGRPSWDVKFLRKALKRNPNIDLVSFFILRDPTDLAFAPERELSLIPFPVNEIFGKELDTFDVVIFQDFHFQPYGIFGYHLRNLSNYVSRDGGAFLMIGGSNSFNSGNYGRTSISEILPVELDYRPKTLSETISSKTFQTELTEIGKSHPITRVIPNEEENERHWSSMPELEGINVVQGLNKSAMSLLSTADGQPILAVENIDTGKVAAFMSDSSWKWNFSPKSQDNISPHYEKFWNRLFLWFVNDPELRDLKISTNKPIYSPGESAKLEITTLNPESINEETLPIVTLPDGTEKTIEIEHISPERYSGEIPIQGDGIYKISVVPEGTSGKYQDLNKSETIFMVEPAENEVRGPTANAEFLKAIARESGGKYITTNESPQALRIDVSKKKTITGYKTKKLWDNPLVFIVLIGMLSSEWLLRRRWGLK